jgi:hypothetical protein
MHFSESKVDDLSTERKTVQVLTAEKDFKIGEWE